MDLYAFEEKLKSYIEEGGRSQAAVARMLGYAPDTFNKWVRGVNKMPVNVIHEFCEFHRLNEVQREELFRFAGYVVPPVTSKSSTDYDIGVVLQLLVAAFEPADLWLLCHGTKFLQAVCQRIERDDPISYMAYRVIEYCTKHDILDELLLIVRNTRGSQFQRFEQFLKSSNDHSWVVPRDREGAGSRVLIFELSEWKLIHSDLQQLVNRLSIPIDSLKAWRLGAEHIKPESAGFQWQELCVPLLRHLPDKWNLQHAYSPVLDILREQTSDLDDITYQLMETDARGEEFTPLYSRLVELRDTLWNVLTTADKHISILVDNLQQSTGEQKP